MNSSEVIVSETKTVAKGTVILTGISLFVCLLMGEFNIPTILGFLLGSIYSVYNFYRMGKTIEKSFNMPPHKAQGYMTSQYFIRLICTGLVIFIGFYVDYINYFGIIIPLIFPKLTIFFSEIFRKEEKP